MYSLTLLSLSLIVLLIFGVAGIVPTLPLCIFCLKSFSKLTLNEHFHIKFISSVINYSLFNGVIFYSILIFGKLKQCSLTYLSFWQDKIIKWVLFKHKVGQKSQKIPNVSRRCHMRSSD